MQESEDLETRESARPKIQGPNEPRTAARIEGYAKIRGGLGIRGFVCVYVTLKKSLTRKEDTKVEKKTLDDRSKNERRSHRGNDGRTIEHSRSHGLKKKPG